MEVKALQAMGAMITQEAGSVSATKFRKPLWMDMKFFQEQRYCGGKDTLTLERFRAKRIRMARKRFAEHGMFQRIWSYKGKVFDKKEAHANGSDGERNFDARVSSMEGSKIKECKTLGS